MILGHTRSKSPPSQEVDQAFKRLTLASPWINANAGATWKVLARTCLFYPDWLVPRLQNRNDAPPTLLVKLSEKDMVDSDHSVEKGVNTPEDEEDTSHAQVGLMCVKPRDALSKLHMGLN
jgi:hypothetical protein